MRGGKSKHSSLVILVAIECILLCISSSLGSMQHWISEKLSEEYDPQLDKTKNIFGEELPSLDFIAKELKDDLKRRHHNQIDDRKLGK